MSHLLRMHGWVLCPRPRGWFSWTPLEFPLALSTVDLFQTRPHCLGLKCSVTTAAAIIVLPGNLIRWCRPLKRRKCNHLPENITKSWARSVTNINSACKHLLGKLRKLLHFSTCFSPFSGLAWVFFFWDRNTHNMECYFDFFGMNMMSWSFRGYYVVVVPLKKQRGGKFINPWEDPDQMNLDEVRLAEITRCLLSKAWSKRIKLFYSNRDKENAYKINQILHIFISG